MHVFLSPTANIKFVMVLFLCNQKHIQQVTKQAFALLSNCQMQGLSHAETPSPWNHSTVMLINVDLLSTHQGRLKIESVIANKTGKYKL